MIRKQDIQLGQTVKWTGAIENGSMGKIVHIEDNCFNIQWSDGEVNSYDYDWEKLDNMEFIPTQKIKATLRKSDIIKLMNQAWMMGFESKTKHISIAEDTEMLYKKYFENTD